MEKRGLVIKNTGSWYLVKTEDSEIECKVKGNFRLKGIRSTNPVTVGDIVKIVVNNEGTAFITEIENRKNYIIRRSSNLSKQSHIIAANLDRVLLIITADFPATSTTFIDRFLASAEAYRVPATLVINKMDAYDAHTLEYVDALVALYEQIGYPCLKISALNDEGMDKLREVLRNKITLFSGNSGVGKSTLINKLVPEANLRTGTISSAHNKGMHTTTFSEMIELPEGGFIIDTPGIKGFGTVDMEKEEIYHFFPDIFKYSENCRFHNCLHLKEPGCAVRDAVDNHLISESRYASYLSMLDDDLEEKYRQ